MQIDEVIECSADKLGDCAPGQARRLFHGRGHTFPGFEHLVITWLPPVLHVATFKPMSHADLTRLIDGVTARCPQVTSVAVQSRDGRRTQTVQWQGEVPEEHLVQEHGLSYWVQARRNQNIGLFLDMGHVRQWLADRMSGARVLNLFAYTCAFSVSALAAGASRVVNNDMSRNALKQGERNHAANGHDQRQVHMLAHDLFKCWKKLRALGPYDVIVIDPPTNQRGSFVAEKDYGAVLKRLPELAAPGACVVACLNSPFLGPDFLQQQVARWAPDLQYRQTLPPHPDFPDKYPDRALKVQQYEYR